MGKAWEEKAKVMVYLEELAVANVVTNFLHTVWLELPGVVVYKAGYIVSTGKCTYEYIACRVWVCYRHCIAESPCSTATPRPNNNGSVST
jgi:hypothetical protein